MQIQSSQLFSEKQKKDVSFLEDPRISITKLYDDMAILLRKFEFSGKKHSPSKISKAREILSRIYNFTQSGQPYVGWWVYMCEKTGLSRPTVMQYFKDFKEAGLIRYELTFYKGKPVTYIHTTEVIDCFFMQIASGQKDDNIIVNDMIKFNQDGDSSQKSDIIQETEFLAQAINRQQEAKYNLRGQKFKEWQELQEYSDLNYTGSEEKRHLLTKRMPLCELKPNIQMYSGVNLKISHIEYKHVFDKIVEFINAEFSRIPRTDYRYINFKSHTSSLNKEDALLQIVPDVQAIITTLFIAIHENYCNYYKEKQIIPTARLTTEIIVNTLQAKRMYLVQNAVKAILDRFAKIQGQYPNKTYTPNQQQPQTVATGINVGKIKTQEQVLQEIQEQRQMVSDTTFNEIKEAIKQRAREDKANATTSSCPPSQRFENAKRENAKINTFEREKLGGKEIDTTPQHKPKEKEPNQVGNLIGMVINSNKN